MNNNDSIYLMKKGVFMELYVKDKKYVFNNDELNDRYLSEGNESNVYIVDNEVFKIYKPICGKRRLDEKTATFLSKLKTSNIVLPKNTIYDKNHNFIGYTMDYLDSYKINIIKNMNIVYFVDQIKALIKDINYLSDNNIDLYDFNLDNIIINDKINIIDPGSFEIKKNNRFLHDINNDELNELILKLIKYSLKLTKKKEDLLRNKFEEEKDFESLMLVYNEKDTVGKVVNKILKY